MTTNPAERGHVSAGAAQYSASSTVDPDQGEVGIARPTREPGVIARIPQFLRLALIDKNLGGPGEGDIDVLVGLRIGQADPTVLSDLLELGGVDPGKEPEISIESGPMSRDGPTPERALLG